MTGVEITAAAAVAGPASGAVLKTIGDLLFGWVSSKIKTTLSLQSNLDVLVKEMDKLMDRRKEVEDDKEVADKEVNEIRALVKKWLVDVQKLRLRVNPIQEEMVNDKKPSRCFFNCKKRYIASKEVEEILEEIKRLLEDATFPKGVVYPARIPRAVEHIPGPSIQGQTTASKALAKVLSLLYDDRAQMIGIWGLGGIGKTTLVKNLNNELNNTSMQPFGSVIWATVSKNVDIKNVQTQIANRLNLELKTEKSVERIAIRLHQRLMNEEKYLLILDDVWQKLDLDNLGVPQPDVHKGSKIILTTRFMEVCRKMMTDIEVKIVVLNDEEAWQLFSQKAGDVSHLEEIKPFAEAIVGECCGLPLAIIIVGAAMRRKTKVELWEDALKQLRRSVPSVGGIEEEVYKPLKWSYDSLQGNSIKSCFLYCSLFPEDFSIEVSELVLHWRAEGLIDEQQNYVDSVNRGIALIENLKDSCLLEDGSKKGTVKMHDVVRDVAIWITSSFEDGCKSLVRSGIGLTEISVGEFSNSNSLKRISFMNNEITRLPTCMIRCPKTSTLLLQHNPLLVTVPERFLQGFEVLKVLNLTGTRIRSLPLSLFQLGDLRALILRNCFSLEELPPLGGLSKLQMLNLCATRIKELPCGMEKLSNLRQLDLSHTDSLKTIQTGIFSRLSCLEVLDMTESAYNFLVKGEEGDETTFEELRYLDQLLILSIRLKEIPCLSSDDLSWINRITRFHFCIGPKAYPLTNKHDKRLTIDGLDLSQESIGQLWGIASSLVLSHCSQLKQMLEDLVICNVGCFGGLKTLTISTFTSQSLWRDGGLAAQSDLLPNLEELTLHDLNELESISGLVGHLGLRFLRLKLIAVRRCSNIKYLLSCGDFIQNLPNVEVIKVSTSYNLKELFNYDSVKNMAPDPVVPNLRILELKNLPNLRTLCRDSETWPRLEQVEVFLCNRLKRLPLTNQNTGTIKEILGESEWWDALEWDDDKTKSSLLPYFYPTVPDC
ncbi:disease resistance protein At4g27190-like isoform X3 [Castanea sativa]